MTERNLSDLPEEERKRVMEIISKIDDMKINQGNDYTVGNYKDAIKTAENIIEIAKAENLSYIVQEQLDYIENCKLMQKRKEKMKIIKEEAKPIIEKHVELLEKGNVFEAHKMIEEFKAKYDDFLRQNPILIIRSLFARDKAAWSEYFDKQQELIQQLKNLERQASASIEKKELNVAQNIINEAKGRLNNIKIQDFSSKWEALETQVKHISFKESLIDKVETRINSAVEFTEHQSFDDALNVIESMLQEVKGNDLIEQEEKLNDVKEEIIIKQTEYQGILEEIKYLEQNILSDLQEGRYQMAIANCERVIELSRSIRHEEYQHKYTSLLDEIKSKIEEEKENFRKEQQLLEAKAKDIEGLIEIEDNVMPLIEEFSASDILGDISDDVNELLNQIGGLLKEHRVEIKRELKNKSVLISKAGEVVENEKEIKIDEPRDSDDLMNIQVQSGLENPFSDSIEEAIISDLIPYNYEISNILLNGKDVQELPDKNLTKEGLKLNWKLKDIPAGHKIDINYNLRRRVSRTIILLLRGNIKIVKTHSKISPLDLEGLNEARLPLTNTFDEPINGVVVEDIVPLYYINFIIEPKAQLPEKSSLPDKGELIKWNVGTLSKDTLNYQYKLLEIYKIEELKITINEYNNQAMESVDEGNIIQAIKRFKQIRLELKNYVL